MRSLVERDEAGDPQTRNDRGTPYADGDGVSKDDARTCQWIANAAVQGRPSARFEVGMRHVTGTGVIQGQGRAAQRLRSAPNAGKVEAMFFLGEALRYGKRRRHASTCGPLVNAATGLEMRDDGLIDVGGHPFETGSIGLDKDGGPFPFADPPAMPPKWKSTRPVVLLLALLWLARPVGAVAETDADVQRVVARATQGAPDAQLDLGLRYWAGRGVPHDPEEAIIWLRKSATGGNGRAQIFLAGMLVERDGREAFRWGLEAARQGYAFAQGFVGGAFERGLLGQKQDYEKAVYWYQRAADQGDPVSLNNLGRLYAMGTGVPQDRERAFSLYLRAAQQGFVVAQENVGDCYFSGKGVAINTAEALRWYRKAAALGSGKAQWVIGTLHLEGRGVPRDPQQGVEWLEKAAASGFTQAEWSLGELYEQGVHVRQDFREAARRYRTAAERGFAAGQPRLGQLYARGRGVPQNYEEAAKWFARAAEQGLAGAQVELSYFYADGIGVPQNDFLASKWAVAAAEQGQLWGQYNAGATYLYGHGGKKDPVEALKWLILAASHATGKDWEKCAAFRDWVAADLSAAQVAEAQRRAALWQPKAVTPITVSTEPVREPDLVEWASPEQIEAILSRRESAGGEPQRVTPTGSR